ncbi:hypothetical protein M2168_001163 [Streptomyces sp. CZ24]|nr:hypothetical protein [Streptomyces sp. CZ24]
MEAAQQARQRELPPDHVDAQRPAARPHRGDGPLGGLEQSAGVGKERLPVDGEPCSPRVPDQEPDPELLLQRSDALGHRLGRDRQIGGGVLELAGVHDGHEGTHGGDVHAGHPRSGRTTIG